MKIIMEDKKPRYGSKYRGIGMNEKFKIRGIKVELSVSEIEEIIDELERVPHNIFEFMNLKGIIKKLNEAIKNTLKKN